MTLLTPSPPIPDRSDPSTFADLADGFVAWMAQIAEEINGGALGATWAVGTVGEPSVRANTDENTGLNFLGSDQLQLVTGGVQRLLLDTAEALINLPLRVAETLEVSAASALNNLGAGNHLVYVSSANAATVGGPSGASRGVVRQERLNASYTFQTYSEANGTYPRQWVRINDNGTWRSWQEVHNARSSVGTVAGTGGAPTGALMERGSNSNGEYARFASGLQICWEALTISSGGTLVWTFPAEFGTGEPIIFQGTPNVSTDQRSMTGSGAATDQMTWYGWTTAGVAWNGSFRALAIGFWD